MDAFIGEVRAFSFSWAPAEWALCDGSALPQQQNQALYAVIGVMFGAQSSMVVLPDLRGIAPMGAGSAPGITPRTVGQTTGSESVALTTPELGSHTHTATGQSVANYAAMTSVPTNQSWYSRVAHVAVGTNPAKVESAFSKVATPATTLSPLVIGASGGTTSGGVNAHENRQPSLAMNFCIALTGVFPERP